MSSEVIELELIYAYDFGALSPDQVKAIVTAALDTDTTVIEEGQDVQVIADILDSICLTPVSDEDHFAYLDNLDIDAITIGNALFNYAKQAAVAAVSTDGILKTVPRPADADDYGVRELNKDIRDDLNTD